VKRLVPVFLILVAPSLFASIDTVRQNYLGFYAAAGADRSTQAVQDSLAGLEAQTRQITAPGFLLDNGSWSDINYKDVPSGSWSPWDHTRRLIVMAKAYRTPGQAFYNDERLRTQIEAALAYVPTYYGILTFPSGNWWFWTIGVPIDLGPTLVMMQGSVSASVIDDCVRTMAFHIGSSPTAKGLVGPTPTGENLVWSAYTHLALGLLKNDAAMLGAVRDAMATACATTTADGIQPDLSFHQHGSQLYTGGYGGSFANDATRYALLTRGSEYALPAAANTTLMNYVADGVTWSLYGNYFDVSAIGREVARSSSSGFNGIAALLQAAAVDSPRQAEIRAAAARMLQSWTYGFQPELTALAAAIDPAAAQWPAGHQHYYASDYTIHRRPGWFASIRMFSKRTKSGENTNGEDILGSRQSDGRFYLVLDGDEYFGPDVFPALDWTRLPGITVEQKSDTANDMYGFGTRDLAGGTGDGVNGVSAMDLAPINSVLAANKSWFFFDDAIVFLTNGITSPSANRVETIINQWPLRDPSAPLTRSGNWLVCDRVGYYVYPQAAALNVTRALHSGTWASLGGSTDTTPHSATFLTLWLDHGTAPINAAAAYAIVPGATAQSMASWIPPSILANTPSASAVAYGDAVGVVVRVAGASAAGFSADAPSVIYATTSGTTMTLSVADPTNGIGTVHVTVPGRYATTAVPFTSDAHSTMLTIPRNGGRTTRILLTPSPHHRAARK